MAERRQERASGRSKGTSSGEPAETGPTGSPDGARREPVRFEPGEPEAGSAPRPTPEPERDITPAPIGDLLGTAMRRLVDRGRRELERAARQGRTRLELRQLQKDRDAFWIRLGKTAYRLAESGEIDHPALHKAMARIDELDERIRDLAASRITAGDEVEEPSITDPEEP